MVGFLGRKGPLIVGNPALWWPFLLTPSSSGPQAGQSGKSNGNWIYARVYKDHSQTELFRRAPRRRISLVI